MAYLGTRGYTIPKASLTIAQQDRIRRELSVAPAGGMMGFARPPPYPVYREATTRFYLPRFYGERTFGPPTAPSKLKPPENIELTFAGKLREDQQKVSDLAVSALRNRGGGLLELHCGYGKTVLGLQIIAALGVKTMVLVHKEFLMTQWEERIEQFLPGARVGRVQGQTLDMDDKDIILVMIQSLAMKDYSMDQFRGVGLVIVDECHHMSAEVFSNALFKAVAPHVLGLSATMIRKDGLSRVFKMFLGEVIAKRVREGGPVTEVRVHRYHNPDPVFNETVLGYTGSVNFSSMLSKLSTCEHRLDYVAEKVYGLVHEDERVQILVLTHYRAMIDALSDRLQAMDIDHGYYVGGMKPGSGQVGHSAGGAGHVRDGVGRTRHQDVGHGGVGHIQVGRGAGKWPRAEVPHRSGPHHRHCGPAPMLQAAVPEALGILPEEQVRDYRGGCAQEEDKGRCSVGGHKVSHPARGRRVGVRSWRSRVPWAARSAPASAAFGGAASVTHSSPHCLASRS